MHIIRVESSLLDGSYTLVPDDGEIQQEEAANVIVVEDLSDSANPQQEGKHRT
ncbi:MAG TPA: hypothetical protein VFK94_03780 [Patescibacteria group bacterium]|nr:hypothetical protein [Patescibacteria group bacterium]